MIDLHGQQVERGPELALEHLDRVRKALGSGDIKPNWKDDQHIYKIICGYGHHSCSGEGMMKRKLKE